MFGKLLLLAGCVFGVKKIEILTPDNKKRRGKNSSFILSKITKIKMSDVIFYFFFLVSGGRFYKSSAGGIVFKSSLVEFFFYRIRQDPITINL